MRVIFAVRRGELVKTAMCILRSVVDCQWIICNQFFFLLYIIGPFSHSHHG